MSEVPPPQANDAKTFDRLGVRADTADLRDAPPLPGYGVVWIASSLERRPGRPTTATAERTPNLPIAEDALNNRTMTDAEAIMDVIRQREAKILASTSLMVDLQNPFRRPAMSARDVAWELKWIKTTPTGRESPDTERVKREFARLCAAGELVEAGSFRTLHAGASTTLCYCTPGYMVRRRARIVELCGSEANETEPANLPRP
ncbi:hypothetical protein [Bradyrhizobium sp. USDA 4350]